MVIYLVGSMGVGKSALGRRIASTLDLPLLDTDELIVSAEGITINEIFEKKGEDYFRKLEKKVLIDIDTTKPSIIATGGGLPIPGDNMEYMKKNGVVVYLQAEVITIIQRLHKGRHKRPAIKDLDMAQLTTKLTTMLKKRTPIYEKAHLTFARSEDVDSDANQLSTYLNMFV